MQQVRYIVLGVTCVLIATGLAYWIDIWRSPEPVDIHRRLGLETPTDVDPNLFNPVVAIPQRMPTIMGTPVASAAEADEVLEESELVIGVTIDGQSRAYPINMLTGPRREIINDELAGRVLAATW